MRSPSAPPRTAGAAVPAGDSAAISSGPKSRWPWRGSRDPACRGSTCAKPASARCCRVFSTASQIVEGVHPFGAAAQFAHGLRAAQHQDAHHRGFAPSQVELLGEPLGVLGDAALPADAHRQPFGAQPRQGFFHRVLVIGHHRVAVGFLVARVYQGVERQGIVFRRGDFLFHEGAERAHRGGIQLPVHVSSVSEAVGDGAVLPVPSAVP